MALAPPLLFERPLADGRLVQPFAVTVVTGAYWLTRLKSKSPTEAMTVFRDWLTKAAT